MGSSYITVVYDRRPTAIVLARNSYEAEKIATQLISSMALSDRSGVKKGCSVHQCPVQCRRATHAEVEVFRRRASQWAEAQVAAVLLQ